MKSIPYSLSFLFLGLIILFPIALSGQADSLYQLGLEWQQQKDYPKAIAHIQEAVDIRRQAEDADPVDLAAMLHSLGQCQYSVGRYNTAIGNFSESLRLRRASYGDVHTDIGKSLNNIGLCFMAKQDFPTAQKYLEESVEVKKLSGDPNQVSLSTSFYNLGNCYYFLGDFERSLSYHLRCYDIRAEELPENHRFIGDALLAIGTDYVRLYDMEKAESYYLRALAISEGGTHPDPLKLAGLYDNLGQSYARSKKFEKALEYHKQSAEILEKAGLSKSSDIARAHLNLGMVYREMHRFEESLDHFQRALAILKAIFGPKHSEVLTVYYSLAKCYEFMGDAEQTLQHYEKAFALENTTPDFFKNPEMTIQAYGDYGLFIKKQYEKTGDPAMLVQSSEQLRKGMEALEEFRNDQMYLSSRSRVAGRVMSLFEHAALNLIEMEKKGLDTQGFAKAFEIAERSKAWVLFEAMKESQALQTGGVPKEIIEEDYAIRADIAYLERKRQDLLDAGREAIDPDFLQIERQLLELRENEQAIKRRLEREYPNYARARYDLQTIPLPEVQAGLKPGETLLEYLVGDTHILLYIVGRDQLRVVSIPLDFKLSEQVAQLRQGLTGYEDYANKSGEERAASAQLYAESAQLLYQKLLAPAKDYLTETLIIVPDGILGLIPFEALLSGAPKKVNNFGTYPYLLNDHTISYAYSATLRKEMAEKQHARTPAKTVLAMAPFSGPDHAIKPEESQAKIAVLEEEAREAGLPPAGSRNELASLKYSAEEAQVVRDIWDGDLFTGASASLEQFIGVADQYHILHLSTHARADNRLGEHCFLAFSGDSLYVRDIYNLRLNADLVVLSACETGEGELLRGEGVISLARAFAYAGARSVVTSLWEVNDAATKEVMQRFHFYLHEGYDKDEALRVAKQQFMKKNPGVLGHPYFWAGFIVNGDLGKH